MPSFPGDFIWYDVMTPDPDAGRAFYKAVLGWNMADSGLAGHEYTLLSVGSTMVGGLMRLPDDAKAMGVPPCWTGYIGSADVDADIVRLLAAGGSQRKPAEDIPGIGRFAVVADPQGAVFILFTPAGSAPEGAGLPQATGPSAADHQVGGSHDVGQLFSDVGHRPVALPAGQARRRGRAVGRARLVDQEGPRKDVRKA